MPRSSHFALDASVRGLLQRANIKQTAILLSAAAISLLATSSVHAGLVNGDIVNVDFNGSNSTNFGSQGVGPTATGAAAIGAPGDFWNGESITFTGSTPPVVGTDPALKTAANVASGAAFTWSTDTAGGQLAGYNVGSSVNTANTALMQDYIFTTQGSGATPPANPDFADFSSLPAGTYNLYLYSQGPSGSNRFAGFSVSGASAYGNKFAGNNSSDTGFVLAPNSNSNDSTGNYVLYTGISPDANGNLDIAYWSASVEGDFNGLQLQAVSLTPVPEPGSLAVMGLAGLLLMRRSQNR